MSAIQDAMARLWIMRKQNQNPGTFRGRHCSDRDAFSSITYCRTEVGVKVVRHPSFRASGPSTRRVASSAAHVYPASRGCQLLQLLHHDAAHAKQ